MNLPDNHTRTTPPPPEQRQRQARRDLALLAADVLRCRHRRGRYALDDSQAALVTTVLTRAATAPQPAGGPSGDEVAAFAHRILDDDHPEHDPLWPTPVSDPPGPRGSLLADARDLPDDGLGQGPMHGHHPTPPVGGWR